MLVSDQDFIAEVDGFGGTDHPDRDGVFFENVIQNGDNPDYLAPGSGTALGVASKATVARWTSAVTHQRGLLDRNFLYDDNSVELFTDLPWQDNEKNPLIQVPARGDLFFMWYSYLPER